jgi:predicted DNA-binding transcriptional regulator YafY
MSGADMASRLGIDGRTLRRYIATLEELGIPVTAERGRSGGYALIAGFKLPPMMFTEDETLALSIGLLAVRGLGLAEAAPAVASAQAKLERVMPANLKQRLRAAGETVQLGMPRSATPAGNTALLALSGAAQSHQRVALRYRAIGDKVSDREFDTFGLAYREGCWYAVGMCHLRRAIRSFRVDRVVTVKAMDAFFERPPQFDAMSYLVHSLATLPRTFAIEVLIKADVRRLQALLFDAVGLFEETPDGVVVRNQSDDLDWFARQLASLPFDFEIRHPPELRHALRACAERLQRRADS